MSCQKTNAVCAYINAMTKTKTTWSSDKARDAGMHKLNLVTLKTLLHVDDAMFAALLAKKTIQQVLPPLLRSIGLNDEAARCEKEGTVVSAFSAARAAGSTSVHAARTTNVELSEMAFLAKKAASQAAAAAYSKSASSAVWAVEAAMSAEYALRTARHPMRDTYLLISANAALETLAELKATGVALLK